MNIQKQSGFCGHDILVLDIHSLVTAMGHCPTIGDLLSLKGHTSMRSTVNSGISCPEPVRDLLRSVARARQARHGGRCSASAVFVELVRAHEDDLRSELQEEKKAEAVSK